MASKVSAWLIALSALVRCRSGSSRRRRSTMPSSTSSVTSLGRRNRSENECWITRTTMSISDVLQIKGGRAVMSSASGALGLGRLGEEARFPLEVARVLEALVDAGEAEVGNLVQGAQPLEDGDADLLAGELGALQPKGLLDLGRQRLELVGRDRPVLGGRPEPGHDFPPLEGRPVPRTLGHHQGQLLQPLVGGEAPAARQALPPPPDGTTVLGEPRVDHFVVEVGTGGTPHLPDATPRLPPGGLGTMPGRDFQCRSINAGRGRSAVLRRCPTA